MKLDGRTIKRVFKEENVLSRWPTDHRPTMQVAVFRQLVLTGYTAPPMSDQEIRELSALPVITFERKARRIGPHGFVEIAGSFGNVRTVVYRKFYLSHRDMP